MVLSSLILIIIALFLPPIPVAIKTGCSIHLVINLLLFVFTLYIGSLVHAIYIILTKD